MHSKLLLQVFFNFWKNSHQTRVTGIWKWIDKKCQLAPRPIWWVLSLNGYNSDPRGAIYLISFSMAEALSGHGHRHLHCSKSPFQSPLLFWISLFLPSSGPGPKSRVGADQVQPRTKTGPAQNSKIWAWLYIKFGLPPLKFSDSPEAKFPFLFLDLTFVDFGLGLWTGTGPRACQFHSYIWNMRPPPPRRKK